MLNLKKNWQKILPNTISGLPTRRISFCFVKYWNGVKVINKMLFFLVFDYEKEKLWVLLLGGYIVWLAFLSKVISERLSITKFLPLTAKLGTFCVSHQALDQMSDIIFDYCTLFFSKNYINFREEHASTFMEYFPFPFLFKVKYKNLYFLWKSIASINVLSPFQTLSPHWTYTPVTKHVLVKARTAAKIRHGCVCVAGPDLQVVCLPFYEYSQFKLKWILHLSSFFKLCFRISEL